MACYSYGSSHWVEKKMKPVSRITISRLIAYMAKGSATVTILWGGMQTKSQYNTLEVAGLAALESPKYTFTNRYFM